MPLPFGSTANPPLVALPIPILRVLGEFIAPEDWHNFIVHLASVVPSYIEGQFTGTLTGCTTAPTQLFNYIQISNFVYVLPLGNLTALSNSTACTITGLPPSITPKVNVGAIVGVTSSGVYETAFLTVGSNGIITLGRKDGSTTFVNDNLTKGLDASGFAFTLSS